MDKTRMAVDAFDRRAELYQEKYMDVSLYHDTFDFFCDHVTRPNARILEIACGPGNITRYLLTKRPDFRILGIDLAPNMIELAKKNNPEAEFQLMDCRNIGRLGKTYDAILCGFALPYLTKEEAIQLIRDASGLLGPGGMVYISTMEDEYSRSRLMRSSSGEDEIFIHYHQADYLTRALEENGFTILDVQRKVYPGHDGTTTTDLVIVGGMR